MFACSCWLAKLICQSLHFKRSFTLGMMAQHQWLGVEKDQLPRGSTRTSSGNFQEAETCMVQACHTPQQPLQNHPSRHLGGWTMLWSAEEMLDGQHQRVDIPAHAGAAHKGLLQKRLEEELSWIVPHKPPTTQSVKGLNWAELNWWSQNDVSAEWKCRSVIEGSLNKGFVLHMLHKVIIHILPQ